MKQSLKETHSFAPSFNPRRANVRHAKPKTRGWGPSIFISTYYFPTPDFQTFLRLWVFILLWLQIIRSLDELKSILDTYSSALSQFLNWHWRISIIYIEVRYLLKEVLKPMFFLFGEILGFQYLSQHTVPWMESNSQKLVSRNFLDNPLLPGRNACKKSNLI